MRSLWRYTSLVALGVIASCGVGDSESESGGESVGEADLASQALAPEPEPNGTAATAVPIGPNTVVRGNIVPGGDVDYYSFQAQAGDRVFAAVMTSFGYSGTDGEMDLLGPDGTTVIENDDDNGSLSGTSPTIAGATIPAAGTYYLRVFYSASTTSQLAPYDLHFRLATGAPTPEVEPNDMAPQALPASGYISGSLSAATDIDVYSIDLQAGDTLFASLDLDPTRDGTEFNGALTIGPFASTGLQVNDSGAAGPDSEALFATVLTSGTYYVGVSGAAAGDYLLSVSVHPAAPQTSCTTYTSSDVPKAIPAAGGQVTSTITVPGNVRIGDVDVRVTLNHVAMTDVDAYIISPAGNTNGLFTDVGAATYPNMDVLIDEEAAFPISTFTLINGYAAQPESAYRMSWLYGEQGAGTWTLVLNDDVNNANGGNLTGWSVTLCDAPIPALTCTGSAPVTAYTNDFEAGDGGFTHSGTADTWARGAPTAAPIATCNSGTSCWKTNLSGTYAASSTNDLVSAPIDLTQLKAPIQLRWALKYQLESVSYDHAWVEIREVGGVNPRRVWQHTSATMTTTYGTGGTTLQESAGWGTQYADVGAYAGKQVELVVHLDTDSSGQYAGLAIDDVSVVGCPAAVCGDGTVGGAEACDDGNLVNGDGCDANCTPTACGNGIVTTGETCDDGNTVSGDGCDANCKPTGCGNGVVTTGEACDDGNTTNGDGCDGNCTPTACGNGIVTTGEACDDGNTVNGDGCDSNCTMTGCGNGIITAGEVCDDGNTVSGDGCDANCTPTACGNGVVTTGEACDDGNTVNGDGCDANCTMTGCGNGIITAGEGCDDGNQANGDGCDDGPGGNCTESACGNGVTAGTEACDDGNTTDGDGCDGNCTVTACGNGVLTTGEGCDDGNTTDGDGCDSNCTATACGNGVKTGTEACDDGNTTDGDGCDNNCTVSACGNGVMAGTEACDDGNTTDGDGCDSNCTATACGNGVKTGTEACDDGNTVDGDGCDNNCTVSACGNGVKAGTEACDDGNTEDGDGCDGNCTVTACGNGIITDGEECDDGNTNDGDGCSAKCSKEGTGGAGGGGTGGQGGTTTSTTSGNDEPQAEGGCGCEVPGNSGSTPWSPFALLAGLGVLRLRRRRAA